MSSATAWSSSACPVTFRTACWESLSSSRSFFPPTGALSVSRSEAAMYQLSSVDKKFPGVHALKSIDFHIKRGEIVGLVGENGAGKSTPMKVIYGAYQPDGGQILIDGKPVHFANPRQAMKRGIGMVFQEQSLIPNLTVMENIFLGYEAQFTRLGVVNWKAMAAAAKKQLAKVKMDIDPATVTSALSYGPRPVVALA